MTALVSKHGKQCSANISMALQTKILSAETSGFLETNDYSQVI